MTRFAGANEIAGYTRIESDSFAPTTVVVMTATPNTNVRTLINFSPAASSGFHRTAVRSATAGPLRVGSLTIGAMPVLSQVVDAASPSPTRRRPSDVCQSPGD